MKLADVRRVSIKQGVRIRFMLPNGLECTLNEHGVAQIPSLQAPPDFSLEDQFGAVEQFTLETLTAGKDKPAARKLNRAELAALAGTGPEPESHHDDD